MTKFERKFVLKHVFSNVSEIKEDEAMYSATETHFGIPWRISVEKKNDHLDAFLHCEPEQEGDWSVETDFSLEIVSPLGKTTEFRFTTPFKKDATSWGPDKFIKWEEIKKNYLKNDQLLVRCTVTIKSITGIAKKRLRDFDKSVEDLSDVVLKVGDENFHVSKPILANYSTYFKSLFFSKFDEAKKPEIELKEIDPKEFQDFLEMIYGESAVNDDNVERVLKLAEMYDASIVTRKSEEYLLTSSEIPTEKKIRLSSQFNLKNLLQFILDQQKTVEDVRSLLPLNLKDLSSDVTQEVLQKILDLTASK